MEEEKDAYVSNIDRLVESYVFNIGHSGEIGGQYIIDRIMEKRQEKHF